MRDEVVRALTARRGGIIEPTNFEYLFGRVDSNKHNKDRSNQLALEMERLGIHDTDAGREILSNHFADAGRGLGNVIDTKTNEWGTFEVRESLLYGPSGKAVLLRTQYRVMAGGSRRFTTTIPMRGKD